MLKLTDTEPTPVRLTSDKCRDAASKLDEARCAWLDARDSRRYGVEKPDLDLIFDQWTAAAEQFIEAYIFDRLSVIVGQPLNSAVVEWARAEVGRAIYDLKNHPDGAAARLVQDVHPGQFLITIGHDGEGRPKLVVERLDPKRFIESVKR